MATYTIPCLTLMLSRRDTHLQCMWKEQHGFLARVLCAAYCWPLVVVVVMEMVEGRGIVKAMVIVMVSTDEPLD